MARGSNSGRKRGTLPATVPGAIASPWSVSHPATRRKGRKQAKRSDSEKGADFTAIMYSVVGTLSMHGIDVLRWLEAWLKACARNGGKPPDDLTSWLPWSMNEERRREFMAPR